jgi:hypothetical protein
MDPCSGVEKMQTSLTLLLHWQCMQLHEKLAACGAGDWRLWELDVGPADLQLCC